MRLFVEGVLDEGQRLALEPDAAHKLRSVLRARIDDVIELRDSAGSRYPAVVVELQPEVAVRVGPRFRAVQRAELRVTLAQCLPKAGKMDYIVEKATELGVARIVPVQSARVIGDRRETSKLDRWRRIARTAAEQCGADAVPTVDEIHDWSGVVADFAAHDRVIIPYELHDAAPRALDAIVTDATSLLVVIGPEGGLSADEIERAVDAGALAVTLGRRIFRTETAGLVTIAAARYAAGEI